MLVLISRMRVPSRAFSVELAGEFLGDPVGAQLQVGAGGSGRGAGGPLGEDDGDKDVGGSEHDRDVAVDVRALGDEVVVEVRLVADAPDAARREAVAGAGGGRRRG